MTLCVIEIGRNRNDGLRHFFTQIIFSGLFHFAQYISADLLRGHPVATHFNPGIAIVCSSDFEGHQINVFLNLFFRKLAPNQAFDRVQRIFGVGDRLAFGRRANQHFAVFLVRNDGWRGARTFSIFDDFGCIAFHDRNTAVGGAQIDADDSSHDFSLNGWG